MSDDDDDGVEPQIEDVDGYYFEDGEKEPVCFSTLPIQFGENDNEADFSRKNVFLRGFADKIRVYKEVVAWKINFDSEQPNIYVLSIEHKWIKLVKPRKCYGEFVRAILITVQMLHFVRRGGQRSCLNHLWDHLDEVFGKYNPKPVEGDLMKHLTLIKKFVEKDQTLMKSKILQRLIENGFERTKKALGLEAQFIVSDGRRVRKNDDNNYGNKEDSGDDCDDGDGSIDDGDDSSDDDNSEDDDSSDDDSSDDVKSDDDDSCDDDGTDQICAICDDGGQLLSCEGPCKRSFHPTKKDGRESKCETLGYTLAEVKKIGTYLCPNCKNKQHQCFQCGELEPSHGPNAKVFQCNRASCGYFYHPKCIAQLLDPNATDRILERRIMAGMSFPCAIHWCFKCGHMENKTQRALKLAVCRRCPRAYHRECLPRELSFGTKDKDGNQRAWKLSKTIFIYCLDHGIDKDTGAPSRNHIKFPATPECTKTKEVGNSKGRMTGKRRKNTDQSTKPIELSNRLCGGESEQAENVGAKSTSPQIVVEPQCAAKRLKDDPQIEQSIIGAANQNGAETMKGHEKQSCVASTETEKRVTCLAQKETCVVTPYDGPSNKGMSDCSVQDTTVDKDVKVDNVACRITEDKYTNGREKSQEDYTKKETAHHEDSSENQGHNDVLELDNLWVEIQADGSPLEPGNKRKKEWQENANGLSSASGQEKETSSSPRSDRGMVPRNDSKIIDYRKGGTTVDNVDDDSSEGSYSCQGVWSRSKCNNCLVAIDQDTSSDRSKKRSQIVQKASDGNKTDLDENKKHNLREDGRDAQHEDRRTERNTAADTSRYKCGDKTQSDRREEPEGRNTPATSREHSPERQRMDRGDSCPETYNRQRCELPHSVNSSGSGGDYRRQGSPCQSSFPLAEFGVDHSHLSPRDSQYRTSPQYLGIPQYDTSRMGSPIPHPRLDHTVDWDTFRDHLHAKYDAMDTGPDRNNGTYRPYKTASVAEHSAVCYQLAGGYYGEGSRASRPVTDKYAPHLDRTNHIHTHLDRTNHIHQRSQEHLGWYCRKYFLEDCMIFLPLSTVCIMLGTLLIGLHVHRMFYWGMGRVERKRMSPL